MRAIVLSIGSELLRGDIVDTNAAYLAKELSHLGIAVERVEARGDTLSDLQAGFVTALRDVDIIVCTGGLGPTGDDLTRQAIAAALGETLVEDESLIDDIRRRFQSMGRSMPERNRQQGTVIPSSEALRNPNGTAPGWFVRSNERYIAAMPGPPSEMEPMWHDSVRPRLEILLHGSIATVALMTFGLGESAVEESIDPVIGWHPDVTVATYAKEQGVQVHISARGANEQAAQSLAQDAEGRVRDILGSAVYGTGADTLSTATGQLLASRGWTVGVIESCSGGALASFITDAEGCSAYFQSGIVAYTQEAKAQFGVDNETMNKHGLVSSETGLALARAARKTLQTDVGIGITGIAGIEPIESKPPGTVYIGLSTPRGEQVREIHRPASRGTVKRFASQFALDLLRRHLLDGVETTA